jgi:hypothetical protein
MKEFELKIWRLHPQGVRLEPADKTLAGTAHPEGVKWCGPFTNANKYGFWLYPPMDIDFMWKGGNEFEHKVLNPWKGEEIDLVRGLIKDEDVEDYQKFLRSFGGRLKVDFGRVEPNICQMWTGCIFQTPPGWALLIRSPINLNMDAPYRIQEGILETDWLTYDIWINIAVQQKNLPIQLRRDQWPPLAQIVPVPKDAYDKEWTFTEEIINRDSEESNRIYTSWGDYNFKKYVRMMHEKEKDSGTYYKERARHLGKRLSEPEVKKVERKPAKPTNSPKATPKRLFPVRKGEK